MIAKTIKISDKWNPAKTWLVKRSKSGHYSINQSIDGLVMYSFYARFSVKFIAETLQTDTKTIKAHFKG